MVLGDIDAVIVVGVVGCDAGVDHCVAIVLRVYSCHVSILFLV